MSASLPMYDTAATRVANDRLWQGIKTALGRGPETLDRTSDPHDLWQRNDLVLSQTCGLPYRQALHGTVRLVGTPDYAVAGCKPGYYCSVIVARKEDSKRGLAAFQGARLARNDLRSQSGWAAIVQELADNHTGLSFAKTIVETGSHAGSARAVSDGSADITAIDAVTWALLERDSDMTQGLGVLTRTRETPGLPFITSQHEDADEIFKAVTRALAGLNAEDRRCLMIRNFVRIPAQSYLNVPIP